MDKVSVFDNLPNEETFNFAKAFAHISETTPQQTEQIYLDWRQNFRRERIDSEDLAVLFPMPSSNKNELAIDIENNHNMSNDNTNRKRKNSVQSVEETNCLAEFRVI
jgi:hypothetical protein